MSEARIRVMAKRVAFIPEESKRVAFVPEELISSYHFQKPEFRIEDDIDKLLEKAKLPDDMKVKLLGQLITRYHKTIHAPPKPVPVSIADGTQDSTENLYSEQSSQNQINKQYEDPILKDIILSTPHRLTKYIQPIVEKLKTREYTWNDSGEMIVDNKVIHGSNVADFFYYLMRNIQSLKEPLHFQVFLKAIKEIKIPHSWIGNKKVLAEIRGDKSNTDRTGVDSNEDLESVFFRKPRKSNRYSPYSRSRSPSSSIRSHSTPRPGTKWLEY